MRRRIYYNGRLYCQEVNVHTDRVEVSTGAHNDLTWHRGASHYTYSARTR